MEEVVDPVEQRTGIVLTRLFNIYKECHRIY